MIIHSSGNWRVYETVTHHACTFARGTMVVVTGIMTVYIYTSAFTAMLKCTIMAFGAPW